MFRCIKIISLVFVVQLLQTAVTFAQRYDVKVYSVNEGLYSGQVFDVVFTNDGYAWFGTVYGITKSDGITFTNYGNESGFRNETINDLFIDSNNNFWVTTSESGVGIFKNDTLIYPEELDLLNTADIHVIAEDNNGFIWFGTIDSGLFRYNISTKKLEHIAVKEIQGAIWDIKFYNEKIWLATNDGVIILNSNFEHIQTYNKTNGLDTNLVFYICEVENGDKWIATSRGVSIIKNDSSIKNISTLKDEPLGYVYSIQQDKNGRIWVGTERNGLFWVSGETVTHVTKNNGLSSNFIFRLVKDKAGDIWVTTDGNGVTIFRDTRFTIFDESSPYKSREVFDAIKDSKGSLWFTNSKHLTKYRDGKFTHFPIPKDYTSLEFWDIEELPNGELLLLSFDYSLFKFDGKRITEYSLPNGDRPFYKNEMLINNDGNIVLAGGSGILIYNDTKVDTIKLDVEGYIGDYVNVIHQDKRGAYWIGTENGVVEYFEGKLTRFNKDDGVGGEGIYVIEEDVLGNIWLGSQVGISTIKTSDKIRGYVVETFGKNEGVEMESTFLKLDELGGIWQGTNVGLIYFNVHDWDDSGRIKGLHYHFQNYGAGVEFNTAVLKDDDGNFFFGSADNGIIKFSPNEYEKNIRPEEAPKPFIVSVSAGDSTFDVTANSNLQPFKYNHNNIEITFGALDYKNPNKTKFRYKLEGIDEEYYEQSSGERVKRYTNLPAGEYEFKVNAQSPTSVWSKEPATIKITISKPFWYTWWFILFVILVLFSITYVVIAAIIQKRDREKLAAMVMVKTKEIQEALDEKEVLIKEIHHRVKNNLAVISGLLEMQSWNLKSNEAKRALEDSKLRIAAIAKIHENLYQNKNLGKIDFEKFLNEMQRGVMGTMKDPQKEIELITSVESSYIKVDMALPCGLIVNELITNCFKHAFINQNKGIVKVSFLEQEKEYLLSVSDDGVGVDKDILGTEHTSLGVTLIKALSRQLKAELKVENQDGSHFKIIIPKKK